MNPLSCKIDFIFGSSGVIQNLSSEVSDPHSISTDEYGMGRIGDCVGLNTEHPVHILRSRFL